MRLAILAVGLLLVSRVSSAQGCICPAYCLSITTPSPLPNAFTASSYSLALAVFGPCGPLTWSVASGALPTGLTMSSAGAISGIPAAGRDLCFWH